MRNTTSITMLGTGFLAAAALGTAPATAQDMTEAEQAAGFAAAPPAPQNFATTELQLLYGDSSFGDGFFLGNNGLGETDRLVATLEHFSTWDYGEHFFFVDYNYDSDGNLGNETDFYGEAWEHFSLSKISGTSFGDSSFIRDVNLGFSVNAGDELLIGLVGPRVDLNVPGFDLFTVGVYAYDNWEDPFDRNLDTTYQLTWVWNLPLIQTDRVNLWTQGFVDFIGDQGPVDSQIIWQPQVRVDLGQLMGRRPGFVEAGFEFDYFDDKFGVKGVDQKIFQAMLVFNLH